MNQIQLDDTYHLLTYEEVVEITKELSKQYCYTRYKQEQELKIYKESFDDEFSDLVQDMAENGLSKRNIDNHRVSYEKLANTGDSYIPGVEKSPLEIAEFIYEMLMRTVEENKSNNMFAYKEQYVYSHDYVIAYYKRYFEIKNAIKLFKEQHSKELNVIVQEIQLNGIPVYIIKYIYSMWKLDLRANNQCARELAHCRAMYDMLKDDLMDIAEQVKTEIQEKGNVCEAKV